MFKPLAGIAAAALLCTLTLPGPAAAQQRDGASAATGAAVTVAGTDISSARRHHAYRHRTYHRRYARHYVAPAPRYDYGIPAHRYWGPPYASLWPLPPIWPFGPWPFYY